MLVYDVTDRRSFESIRNWIGQIQQYANRHVNKILVGNKCDMLDEKVVSTEEGQKLAAEFGISFWECSAAVKDRLVAGGVLACCVCISMVSIIGIVFKIIYPCSDAEAQSLHLR